MFLGFDLSTQQLKGVIVDEQLKLRHETVVAFDEDLPHYGTRKGVFVTDKQVRSPVAMWVEALDLLLHRMKEDASLPLEAIQGISGSGQQHGSVYWSAQGDALLRSLDDSHSLRDQLVPIAFAYDLSPNWQDSSTQEECDAIESCVGGAARLAEITGSKAHHRFTGPQIMRLRKHSPQVYQQTQHISLVSSFLCSLLLGRIAPIDPSDICGGSFWNIKEEAFDQTILDCISDNKASDLSSKLGKVCMDGSAKLGTIAGYYQRKYGFAKDCQIMPFTGDNPATILALPLLAKDAMISLGTSTTMLLSTPHYVPSPAYHLFAHPTTKGLHMAMLCYKNGSLARERIRDALNEKHHDVSSKDWSAFNETSLHMGTPRAPRTKLGFYFPLPEIIPQTEAGTWRFLIDENNRPIPVDGKNTWSIPDDDARAILESQFLDIRLRSQPFFSPEVADPNDPGKQASRIYVVGGASKNPAIIKVADEVLGSTSGIYRQTHGSSNACAMGGANKAAWAVLRRDNQSFETFVKDRWVETESVEQIASGYEAGVWEEYGDMLAAVSTAERMIIAGEV